MIRTTHTYALLEISQGAYEEIAEKLRAAGYADAINEEGEIDMHGIALTQCPQGDAALTATVAATSEVADVAPQGIATESPAPIRMGIDQLEKILQSEEDAPIQILPNGEIVRAGERREVKVLTMRENLGGEYAAFRHRLCDGVMALNDGLQPSDEFDWYPAGVHEAVLTALARERIDFDEAIDLAEQFERLLRRVKAAR